MQFINPLINSSNFLFPSILEDTNSSHVAPSFLWLMLLYIWAEAIRARHIAYRTVPKNIAKGHCTSDRRQRLFQPLALRTTGLC